MVRPKFCSRARIGAALSHHSHTRELRAHRACTSHQPTRCTHGCARRHRGRRIFLLVSEDVGIVRLPRAKAHVGFGLPGAALRRSRRRPASRAADLGFAVASSCDAWNVRFTHVPLHAASRALSTAPAFSGVYLSSWRPPLVAHLPPECAEPAPAGGGSACDVEKRAPPQSDWVSTASGAPAQATTTRVRRQAQALAAPRTHRPGARRSRA